MAKRHKDALAIQAGACNPTAIVNSIQRGIEEIHGEAATTFAPTDLILNDPAIGLMVHQLAFLCHLEVDHPSYAGSVLACEALV